MVEWSDRLVSYANNGAGRHGVLAFKRDVEIETGNLVEALKALESDWERRRYYRADLKARGIVLDAEFYEVCTGDGFWKTARSTQTAGGETSEMWEGIDGGCEAVGAVDAVGYLIQLKKELLSGDDGSGCKNPRLVTEQPDKIAIERLCPWAEDWTKLTTSARATSGGSVEVQSLYRFNDGGTVSLDMTYERCDG